MMSDPVRQHGTKIKNILISTLNNLVFTFKVLAVSSQKAIFNVFNVFL